MLARTAIIGAGAVLGIGSIASGQVGSVDRATLLQLSIDNPGSAAGVELRQAMSAESARITSCRNAPQLRDRLKARGLHGSLKIDVKTNVPLAALPGPLRAALLAKPVGTATPVFDSDNAFRVLIRCEPTFVLPDQPLAPAPRTSGTSART